MTTASVQMGKKPYQVVLGSGVTVIFVLHSYFRYCRNVAPFLLPPLPPSRTLFSSYHLVQCTIRSQIFLLLCFSSSENLTMFICT